MDSMLDQVMIDQRKTMFKKIHIHQLVKAMKSDQLFTQIKKAMKRDFSKYIESTQVISAFNEAIEP
jgi:hypothetical protein